MPEWSNGIRSRELSFKKESSQRKVYKTERRIGLVPTQVRILFPASYISGIYYIIKT